jgi:sulfur carrier protein ThiS
MKITAIFLPRREEEKNIDIAHGSTGIELLKELDLSPDAHILIRDKNPIPLDEKLLEGESIGIIKVVSGG